MNWLKYNGKDCFAIAICNYQPSTPQLMKLRLGDFIFIQEYYPSWYRGFKLTEPTLLKVFPSTHIKLLPSEFQPDLWAEIYSWLPNIRNAYLELNGKDFDQIIDSVQSIWDENLKVENTKITESNRRVVIEQMSTARKHLGLPFESRNEKGDKVDLKSCSVLDLYTQHEQQSGDSGRESAQLDNAMGIVSIYIKMLSITFEKNLLPDDKIDVNICLYRSEDKNKISRISETFCQTFELQGRKFYAVKTNDLVMNEIQYPKNQKVFLVFQLIRTGCMVGTKKVKKYEAHCRRPKGIAILEVISALYENHEAEYQIGIHLIQREEFMESIIEQLIHDYHRKKVEYTDTINIQLKSVKPDDIKESTNVLLGMNPYFSSPLQSKRNCIYLTLYKADIDRENKKSDPNLEVDISIRDVKGKKVILPTFEWRQFDEFKSVIYYHVAKPRWSEVICLPLFETREQFNSETHIRFLISHRSLNDRARFTSCVAYLRIFPKNTSCIIGNRDQENFHVLSFHKMDIEKIKTAEYLRLCNEFDSNPESTMKHGQTFQKLTKKRVIRDTLYVQTQLFSNQYTFDEFLAMVCHDALIDDTILCKIRNENLVFNMDMNEMIKYAKPIFDSSLNLLQLATEKSFLSSNIIKLLGELFKSVKQLPVYHLLINSWIDQTAHFYIHKQILRELINHVPSPESTILKESDWFMKIVVKSFENYLNGLISNENEIADFMNLIDQYLRLFETWASKKETRFMRSITLSKVGPIINVLIRVTRPIRISNLVINLLKSYNDIDTITKAGFSLDCMNSNLFLDPNCRKIILLETTNNILQLFITQHRKIYERQSNDPDQDHLLDNVCDKMIEFMQIHEQSWRKASPQMVDILVYELIIEHRLLRSCIAIMCDAMKYVAKEHFNSHLLRRSLMVLGCAIISSLSFISDQFWKNLIKEQIDQCSICQKDCLTDNYDMLMELFCLINAIQKNQIYPNGYKFDNCQTQFSDGSFSRQISHLNLKHVQSKFVKESWMDILFIQNLQFLSTLKQIHNIIINPFYLENMIQAFCTNQKTICGCHPLDKSHFEMISLEVKCICDIITQPFLNLEKLPSSVALKIIKDSKKWGGDIRLEGATQIRNIWNNLGNLKIRFIESFFSIFTKLTTIPNYKIRLLAVESLFDIVHIDPENKKTELITQIDQAMEEVDSGYCEEMSKAFKQVLSSSSLYADDSQLVEHIIVQMNNIKECSHHLNDSSPINGMIVINNLRKFYISMGRSDIIARYLFKLIKLHQKIKNYTEMGNTLLALSKFYEWNMDLVGDILLPPEYSDCQFKWQLKSKLLEDSLKHFEKEDWEQGIEVCKELISGYMDFLVDFIKLSEVHRKMADLLKKIMWEDRPDSFTYIVFYVGSGFPKFISDLPEKSIVIRTKLRSNEIATDLNRQFKNVSVLCKFPDNNELKSDEKKIYFMPVKTHKFKIPIKYSGPFVKRRIVRYYENNAIDVFVYKRLLNNTEEDARKKKIDGCIVKCDEKLPNILSLVTVIGLEKISIDGFLEGMCDLESQIHKDEILYQDFEMASTEKRPEFYQKMKDVIIRYVAPVSGGVSKLVEMIPKTSENFSFIENVITEVVSLIYLYLKTFEIYDNLDNYTIFVSEFARLLNNVMVKLDIDATEYSIHTLPEQFLKSKQQAGVKTIFATPTISVKMRNEDVSTSRSGSIASRRSKLQSDRKSDLPIPKPNPTPTSNDENQKANNLKSMSIRL